MEKCSKKTCCTIQYGEDAGICMSDNCRCHKSDTTGWADEFDENFDRVFERDDSTNDLIDCTNSVKFFIARLLATQKREIREKLSLMEAPTGYTAMNDITNDVGFKIGYSNAITDAILLLDESSSL